MSFRTSIAVCALILSLGACADGGFQKYGNNNPAYGTGADASASAGLPPLVVTSEPPPDVIYRRGSRDTVLAESMDAPSRVRSFSNQHVETLVTRKVADLSRDLAQVKRNTANFQERLFALQSKSDAAAAKYYELIANINTELQAGTTPGNPVLVERWNVANDRLEVLSQTGGYLNGLATDLANEASKAAYLQESIRSTYALSGAVKEDHEKLRELEDGVNQSIVRINRQLTAVNDEINRRQSYLRSERLNLQTLSLSIANGELYGQNLTNSLFKKASSDSQALFGDASVPAPAASAPGRRPLVIIRFDRPNVNYQQALYNAVGQALEKYPSARFDLIAVSPTDGNPAEMALASSEARKNGEGVLRALTQMGLPAERVRLNAANSRDVRNSEVHLYLQ